MGKLFTRTGLTFLGAVLLAITACGTEASPAPNTTTAPTPGADETSPSAVPGTEQGETATSTDTPTVETVRPEIDISEPEKYPEMANDNLEGADAAARYFLDLYGYVYNTGDLSTWKKISDPDCDKCQFVENQVTSYYEKGSWYENVAMSHGESTLYYPSEELPFYLVVVNVISAPYDFFDARGRLAYSSEENVMRSYAIGVKYLEPLEWMIMDAEELELEK